MAGRKSANDAFWDRVDKEFPEIRREASEEATIIAEKFGPMHGRDEIKDFVDRNYPGLRGPKDIAIGIVGDKYRVVVIDRAEVMHTLKIAPAELDRDLAIKNRVERMEKATQVEGTNFSPNKERDRDPGQ